MAELTPPAAVSTPPAAESTPPAAMTIAGTDSGGGAGIATDLRAFTAAQVHGTFAVTVLTAQNTNGIESVETVSPAFVAAQVDALLDDFDIVAAKTGLLWLPETIEVVAERAHRLGHLVVDPVLVRSTGEPLLSVDVQHAYRTHLFAHAHVLTPNVAEAALLTGSAIGSRDEARRAAAELHDLGIEHVVLTGFLDGDEAVDFHANAFGVHELVEPRVDTVNVHGTGCSFAATIAARLAHGDTAAEAIGVAKILVADAIRTSADWRLGSGHGPIGLGHG